MIRLYVSAPLAAWRSAYARQYWESYDIPPPSTVYGMLLSLVGECNRYRHKNAQLAVALLSEPQRSRVLRTAWKVDNLRVPPGVRPNIGPEWQEVLADVRLCVWVRRGWGEGPMSLADRVGHALNAPHTLHRFGALCLGESTFLVNDLRLWRRGDPGKGRLLRVAGQDRVGMALPVWADHVGSKATRTGTFVLGPTCELPEAPPPDSWIEIAPYAP